MSFLSHFLAFLETQRKDAGRCFALYHLIDRADRLDLSVFFRIVIGMLERMLDNPDPSPFPFFPLFHLKLPVC